MMILKYMQLLDEGPWWLDVEVNSSGKAAPGYLSWFNICGGTATLVTGPTSPGPFTTRQYIQDQACLSLKKVQIVISWHGC